MAMASRWAAGLLGWCGAVLALAAEPPAPESTLHFAHKDWEVACDNTRTCRAAGYQAESGDSEPVSLLITRAAGPDTVPELRLQVAADKPVQGPLSLSVGSLEIKDLPFDSAKALPAAQTRNLLAALLKAETATVRAPGITWQLSLAGLNAVALKMDEFQGRLDTPGAWLRKGTKPESNALPALALPKVSAVRPAKTRASDAALRSALWSRIAATDLELCRDPEADEAKVYRLTDTEVLLALPCSMGAYNSSSLLWRAQDRPPYNPQLLDIDGEFDPDAGSVHSSLKIRGLGDCWSVRTWQLTRQGFVLVSHTADGLCRGFVGGAWGLSRYAAKTLAP